MLIFGWESLVAQKVEKQIKSEVGADCCTEPNGISGPWGPLHPLSVFLLYFQWKWTALRFPTGDYTQGRCVFEGEDRRRVWTQPRRKKNNTNTQAYMNISYSRWMNTETCNCYFHHPRYHTAAFVRKSSGRRENQVKNNRRKEWKKIERREHLLRVRLGKKVLQILFKSGWSENQRKRSKVVVTWKTIR